MNQKKNECPRRFDHAVKGNREITAVMSEGKSDKEIVCVCVRACESLSVQVCVLACVIATEREHSVTETFII